MQFVKTVACLIALSLASAVHSATPIVVGGTLTGATGVNVGGNTYNVEFLDGQCTTLFSGCDDAADFTFQNETDALAAAEALLNQVFTGAYDTQSNLTRGCTDIWVTACEVFIPYQRVGDGVLGTAANNDDNESSDGFSTSAADPYADTSSLYLVTYARFTLAGGVPEPSTWAMMLLGFGAIGFAIRRQKADEAFKPA